MASRRLLSRIYIAAAVAAVIASQAAATVRDFTLPSATDGRLLHLSDFSGKVVLINFWRTSCSDSRRESPKLVTLYEKYHDQGLEILGVSDDTSDSVGQIPTYLRQYGITWAIGLNDQGEFMRELRPVDMGGTPANILVTRSGEVTALGKDLNADTWAKLEAAVAHALAEPVPAHSAITQRELTAAPALSLPTYKGKQSSWRTSRASRWWSTSSTLKAAIGLAPLYPSCIATTRGGACRSSGSIYTTQMMRCGNALQSTEPNILS